ncbi:uncharacterized protein LOC143230496 [Tachypleus tridentatus]|uniref:uncharacterized protein LOC143230496 n=1 Tax=Tachypleus tridentatus TaxID=6853 RepID=UPI003FD171A8
MSESTWSALPRCSYISNRKRKSLIFSASSRLCLECLRGIKMLQVLILTCVIGSSWQQEIYPYKRNVPAKPEVSYYRQPAIVHKVQIGSELQGDYKFTYDTGESPLGQSYRTETRLPDGSVKGSYGYLDQNNKLRIIRYFAGKEGFVAEGDVSPINSPPPAPQPILQHLVANKSPQYLPQQHVTRQLPDDVSQYQRTSSQPPRSNLQHPIYRQPPDNTPQRDFVPEPQLHLSPLKTFKPPPQSSYTEDDFGPPFIDTSLLSYNIGAKQRA